MKVRGGLRRRAVIRVGAVEKSCGSGSNRPRHYFVARRHSRVVMVVSWEVAAHVKCGRALAALRRDKAHSRYLTTLTLSDWHNIMFSWYLFLPVRTHIFQVFCICKAIQACPRSAIQLIVLVVQHCKVPVLRRHVREHSQMLLSLETLTGWQARKSPCPTAVSPLRRQRIKGQ